VLRAFQRSLSARPSGGDQADASSVSSRRLLDTLLGIGLVSAGAGALNEALERKTDARMKRTADLPLPRGAFRLRWALWPGSAHWRLAHCG